MSGDSLQSALLDLNQQPRAEQLRQLQALEDRFVELGSVRGVTALKSREAINSDLLLDSLVVLPALPDSGKIIDIGTGGGVPGLVLAILRPDLSFVLTDAASKKTDFVQETVQELGLVNVEVVTGRLEDLGRKLEFREAFRVVTAKALASLNVLLELSFPLLQVGGTLLALKGPTFPQEREQADYAMSELGAQLHFVQPYSREDKELYLVGLLKSEPTSERYPRRNGVPQKKPLLSSRKP